MAIVAAVVVMATKVILFIQTVVAIVTVLVV